MHRRLSLLLAMTLLGVMAAHSRADSATGVLTLQGSTTAWVDVTLRNKVTIDYAKTVFGGGGQFVGFYAEDLGRAPAQRYEVGHSVGAVQLRDFHGPGQTAITEDLSPRFARTLEPGRYRFYLLTDGPASMRLALTDGPRMSLRPRNTSHAAASVRTDIRTSEFEAANAQPILVKGERALVTSAVMFGPVKRAFVGGFHACVARGDACGDHGIDAGFGPGFVVYPQGEFDFVYGTRYQPGVIRPGALTARQGAQNLTTIEYASAAAFTLSLQ